MSDLAQQFMVAQLSIQIEDGVVVVCAELEG